MTRILNDKWDKVERLYLFGTDTMAFKVWNGQWETKFTLDKKPAPFCLHSLGRKTWWMEVPTNKWKETPVPVLIENEVANFGIDSEGKMYLIISREFTVPKIKKVNLLG